MVYKNYTNEAMYELERQRTMNYGNINEESLCENGCQSSILYNVEGRILCQDCLIEEVRDTLEQIILNEDESVCAKIIQDIFSDFSDSEILTYIENRYDKI